MDPAPLTVRGVHKRYALGTRSVEVLRGVDLTLEAGRMLAIMGPSGVGKSTLLNCIAGLDRPDEGEIEVFGQPMGRLDDVARTLLRRRHVGIVYQFFNLVPNLTAEENVALPFLIEGTKVDAGRREHLPAELSGGEMQIVSIARALVRSPGLVLADEPTGNVNVATGERIMALLREVIGETGTALLLVTHDPEDAARADRVVFMKDGQLPLEHALEGEAVRIEAVHAELRALGI